MLKHEPEEDSGAAAWHRTPVVLPELSAPAVQLVQLLRRFGLVDAGAVKEEPMQLDDEEIEAEIKQARAPWTSGNEGKG